MDEIIERLEREGRANRKPREKKPEKVKTGKRAKRRGYEAEKKVERILADYGFVRVPLSGSLGGKLSGDLIRKTMVCSGCGKRFYRNPIKSEGETCSDCGSPLLESKSLLEKIEVKERKGGFRSIRKWLETCDILILDTGGRDEPMAVLSLKVLKFFLDYA